MSAESKKLIWISVAVCAFVLVLALAGLFLFAPKQGGGAAPASIGNVAAPKAADPQDYLLAPPPAPSLEAPRSSEGDIIVIYGDKPTELAPPPGAVPGAGAAAAVPGAAAGAAPSAAGVQPAPAASAQPAAKPASAAPAPVAKPAAKAVPAKAAPTKTVRVDEYWIQAASFTSRARADELKESLGQRGLAALITVKDISGKSWYRVRVGPYAKKSEAEGWLGRIKAVPGCEEAGIWTTSVERTL